jgi:decaprenylphospho-beta-D-ribofuranose 2-oxidase
MVWAFNRLHFARAPKAEAHRPQDLDSFFYPLDRLGGWKGLYGDRGFLQYQVVVPEEAGPALAAVAELLARSGVPPALAVLKRMGADGAGLLSFPLAGWTLAVDLPRGDPGLGAILDQCDRLVSEAGGRVYLAKDARMRPEAARDMYRLLPVWQEARARLDPRGAMKSDLSNRLRLIG